MTRGRIVEHVCGIVPELPDVEDARRDLQRWLAGATVRVVRGTDSRLTRPLTPSAFARTLVGRRVEGVARKGKWLRIALSDGVRVFSHLGMTGEWTREAVDAPARRFERARIDVIQRGRPLSVRYSDARRFGRLLAAHDDVADWTALGPDPLSDGIDVRRLAEELAKRRRSIKEILMDQRVLAGVGNILATEALWMARVHPRSRGNSLSATELRSIAKGIRRAIALELSSRKGKREGSAASFFVYGRAGKPCPRCGTPLSSLVLGGRTSVFCNRCQVLEPRPRSPSRRRSP